MGLFVEQNSNRSKLQERLAAELQEKARRKQKIEDEGASGAHKRPDGIEDSAYMEGTKKTTTLAWAWIGIGLFCIALVVAVIWGYSR